VVGKGEEAAFEVWTRLAGGYEVGYWKVRMASQHGLCV